MSTKTNTNGQARKSLAEQIDRLDGILDGLADGLNEAVAAAVQEAVGVAVREAVRSVIAEVLTNPDVLALLRAAVGPAAPASQPSAPEAAKPRRVVSHFARARAWVGGKLRQVREACASALRRVGKLFAGVRRGIITLVATVRERLWLVRLFKVQLLTALGVGAAAGVAAYYAGPWLSAGLGWLGGFLATLAVQAGVALRRMVVPPAAGV
jgi:hypothetical protein